MKYALVALLLWLSPVFTLHAQDERCPPLYLTTGTGFNYNTAFLGFSFDVPLSKQFSIDAGVGTGSWGGKLNAGFKYYLKPCQRGFAFGAGLGYFPGEANRQDDLENIYGNKETISYNINPQTQLLLMAYKYWTIGKRFNRIYVETGWAQALGGNKITQLTGNPISDNAMQDLTWGLKSAPILAGGVSFGLWTPPGIEKRRAKHEKERKEDADEPYHTQHHLFADVGYTPGFSVTYNYTKGRRFGMGIGLQGYKMYRPLARDNSARFTPSLFADLRFNIRSKKRNQFLALFDLGIDFYKQDKSYHRDSTTVYNVPHNNGFDFSLGLGYLRRMTKRGGGPYITAKMITNWFTERGYSIVSNEKDGKYLSADGVFSLSLGFKF